MKLPNALRSTRVYWIVTALLCLFIAAGAVFDVAKSADAVKLITGLGYPEYLIRFLGVLKLAGVAAIVTGRFPRLKHWSYAGLVFDTGGALYSHFSAGSATKDWLPALLGLVLVGVSYGLYTITLDPFSRQQQMAS
jgi:DoxX-like family